MKHATCVVSDGIITIFEEGTDENGLRRFRYSIIGVEVGLASGDDEIILEGSEDMAPGEVLSSFVEDLIHNGDMWSDEVCAWANSMRDELRDWLRSGDYCPQPNTRY